MLDSRKQSQRINELFKRLNLQITQEQQISDLNKSGYKSLDDVVKELNCNEEILMMVLSSFDQDTVQTFEQPTGDSLILLKYEDVKKWYEEEMTKAANQSDSIDNYLYKTYIGIDLNGCIPLNAATDFAEQKQIAKKYLVKAIKNNEIQITQYNGEAMVNEDDLIVWIETYKEGAA